ncbi:hypothetical protein [Puia sp.]|uniref:hypothetical protein n=1 Tax=Puia sp. TaxID=2045100 RepID=UPI002F418388
MSLATYSFLPYLRQGIANDIVPTAGARAAFIVKLKANGDALSQDLDDKTIEIYGPGDIIGIDPREVIKTEPHNWITNFESNYLAHIDFYDEDFPWRYTPVQAASQRLNPWIALVVLADGEYTEGQNLLDRPLPYFTLKDISTRSLFPRTDQLWAWAHVHYNGDLTADPATILTDDAPGVGAALDKLQTALDTNPDQAYSRLICPRKLKPATSYSAFLIPAYESGRLAGTGGSATDIANAKKTIAWEDSVASLDYPYYYRWKFNTGSLGDFEYLVRLLKPKVADSRIGRRVMDMTKPEGNLHWEEDPASPLGGILRLGGALKVPEDALTDDEIAKMKKFDDWAINHLPDLHPFQVSVASFLNLGDDYNSKSTLDANADFDGLPSSDPNVDQDPLILPPIYGRWHAMVERVYENADGTRINNDNNFYNWITELNLDPRFRVPAHFGTRVVQENQEDFMNSAWEQIGDVLTGNRHIRLGQFALLATTALYSKHFIRAADTDPSKLLLLTAPLKRRVLVDGATVFSTVKQSVLPNTILSSAMRRIVRPRGRMAVRLQKQLPAGETLRLETVVTRVGTGELPASPPKVTAPALPTVDSIAGAISPAIPGWLKDLLRKYPWLPAVPLGLAILLVLLLILLGAAAGLWIAGLAVAGGLVYLWRRLTTWANQLKTDDTLLSANQTPASVDEWPASNDFKLTEPQEPFSPSTGGTTDNAAAALFKTSVKDMYGLLTIVKNDNPPAPARTTLTLPTLSNAILAQILPSKTIPAWFRQYITIPAWIKDQQTDDGLVEAMAYPKINTPMYLPLKKISDELFLPNVGLLEENSLTLLETNEKFIESYMVGLNHEFARELLWREFPTDQRGSYFRQFWDVTSILKNPALARLPEDLQHEPYYDITRLDTWLRSDNLGDHDNRQPKGQPPKEEVVLVVRGELLKKYPTTVVYAQKAAWTVDKETGKIDVHLVRSLFEPEQGDAETPDPAAVRTPLYQAKIDPDIYFFGFDLTVDEAKGATEPAIPTQENAGWFFVLKERPGELRFGLDIAATDGSDDTLNTWNDLAWSRVLPADEGVIDVIGLPAPLALPPGFHNPGTDTESQDENEQYGDDIKVKWNAAIDSANLAYILYQEPMMVCVHASEMLLKK